MKDTVFTPADLATGSFDAEAVVRSIPRTFQVKGMFFNRLTDLLGPRFASIVPMLQAPPRLGRYVPFADYPQADYLRLSIVAAERLYSSYSLCEGIRRLSRDDFRVFAESNLGKVLLSVIGDAHSALLRAPQIYEKVAPGPWRITGHELDAASVQIRFAPIIGPIEFQLGQLEGMVLSFGQSPRVRVRTEDDGSATFDVHHG
jgi:uncharacterized protein (TIGR02265 family)